MFKNYESHMVTVPAIVQRRLSEDEIRQQVREECAQFLESIKQTQVPEIFRQCDFYGEREHEDGWIDLSTDEKKLLMAAAKALREGRKASDQRKRPESEGAVCPSTPEPEAR
jgi:hypothetical protein